MFFAINAIYNNFQCDICNWPLCIYRPVYQNILGAYCFFAIDEPCYIGILYYTIYKPLKKLMNNKIIRAMRKIQNECKTYSRRGVSHKSPTKSIEVEKSSKVPVNSTKLMRPSCT